MHLQIYFRVYQLIQLIVPARDLFADLYVVLNPSSTGLAVFYSSRVRHYVLSFSGTAAAHEGQVCWKRYLLSAHFSYREEEKITLL